MTPNLRENTYNFALSCHFNVFRHGVLTPQASYTTFTDGSEKVVRFLYARALSGATVVYRVYGLGATAAGLPQIFIAQISETAWTSLATGTTGARAANVFFEYKDCLYFWQNGTVLSQIKELNIDETPTLTQSFQAISYTNVAQPVHHKADDYAYFFSDNNVHRFTGASATTVWSSNVLVLPTNMKIVGAAAYGNYLAIVCSPLELGATNSVMYLWDRDSSLATLTAKVDLGMGEVIHVSEAEDGGIWITQQARRTVGIVSRNNYVSIKYYNGYFKTLEIPVKNSQDYFSSIKLTGNGFEERGVFYFPAEVVTNGAAETRNVIFAARLNNNKIELVGDQEITGVTAGQEINGIYSIGGVWYVSYNTAAQTLVQKITSTYGTGTYESKIFNDGDAGQTKKLLGVTVMFSPLPATATVVLKYRRDAETAWTTIFTYTSTGSIRHSAINLEADGSSLGQYKECQFLIQSTVGAEIIGFKYRSEFIADDIY